MARGTGLGVVEHRREHRERKDAATEPEKRERDGVIRARNQRNDEYEDGSPCGTHRDKPHLDKVPRHAHRKPEARDKPDARTENGIVRKGILRKQRARAELVLDDEHHQEYHDPEHRLPDNRLAERPVLPRLRHLAARVLERKELLPGEFQCFIVGADRREPDCKNQPQNLQCAERIEHGLDQVLADGKRKRHARKEHRAERDYHESPAPAGKETHPYQFLHVAVLCRTLERLQHKEKPDTRKHHGQARMVHTDTEQPQRENRKHRRPQEHPFLRVLVRHKTRRRQQQHAGQQEQQVQHVELPRTRSRIPHAAKDEFRVGNNRGRDRHLRKSQTKKREKAFDLFHLYSFIYPIRQGLRLPSW